MRRAAAERKHLPAVLAALGTVLVLLAQTARLEPLTDAVEGGPFRGAALEFPAGWVMTAPFSALADLLTFSGARQAGAWLLWLTGSYWLWRAFRPASSARRAWLGWAAWLAGVLAFLAWALLTPRPIPRIAFADPELAAVDFHSHSSCSHDGRPDFTPDANAAWHVRAGFRAGFLTDHNKEDCARPPRAYGPYAALTGTELSLHGAHVVVLGQRGPIDAARYQRGQAGLESLLAAAGPAHGAVVVLSLPEYWVHHRGELDRLAMLAGPAGIEISNGSPKALEVQDAARPAVLELARRRWLFPACATDNHGWGQASFCWNVMRLPGHATRSPEDLQAAVLSRLRGGGERVRVAERRRVATAPGARVLLDPLLGLWVLLRTLTPVSACAMVAWLWVLCAVWRAAPGARRRTSSTAGLPKSGP
ncbi:MAG: hypothetical protein HYZ75_05210 [Elusimicrobia bacterium]|nr:hypothetical protein [Elusimicrobiota bacterium]